MGGRLAGRGDDRFETIQSFERVVAEDAVFVAIHITPGRFCLADAGIGKQFASRAAGVEPTAAGRVDGAGHDALQADVFLLTRWVRDRHRREQRLGVGVIGRWVDGIGRPDLHDLAQIHHGHVVGEEAHHAQVVGDEDQRGIELLLHLQQQVEDGCLHRDIQRADRLVAEHQVRVAGQGAGDTHPLFLAAAELARQPIVVVLAQAHGS